VIRNTIKGLQDWIAELNEARKAAKEEWERENASPDLGVLLNQYMDMRAKERSNWSEYGQKNGTISDMQAVSKAVAYLSQHDIVTLQNLDDALQSLNEKAGTIRAGMRSAESRMKTINSIQKAVSVCMENKPVHDKYLKKGWKVTQAAYEKKHKDELSAYNKSYRLLKKQGVDLNVNLDELQAEYDKLSASHAKDKKKLETVQAELKPLKDVRYWIKKVTEPQPEKAPERESVRARLRQNRIKVDEREAQKKPTKTKKQNMEL
jgi:chromosome segregation ATPase